MKEKTPEQVRKEEIRRLILDLCRDCEYDTFSLRRYFD